MLVETAVAGCWLKNSCWLKVKSKEIPNHKHQITNKSQAPNSKPVRNLLKSYDLWRRSRPYKSAKRFYFLTFLPSQPLNFCPFSALLCASASPLSGVVAFNEDGCARTAFDLQPVTSNPASLAELRRDRPATRNP